MIKLNTKNRHAARKNISCGILLAFVVHMVFSSISPAFGQEASLLPLPGSMVSLSDSYQPIMLKGLKVFADNPFEFAFILDPGDAKFAKGQFTQESTRLVKYFMAAMTIPENDLWVNLSPYEKNRIVADAFGVTQMGRDLLAQDYFLKQLAASLTNPETELGKKYWDQVNGAKTLEARRWTLEKTTNDQRPASSDFNKVWIVPGKAKVYENAKTGTVFIVESSLKVMLAEEMTRTLEGGRWTLEKNNSTHDQRPASSDQTHQPPASNVSSQTFRSTMLPIIEKEVNEGKNFAALRQVYQALILAAWYKMKIKDSVLSQVYADQKKVAGITIDDPKEKQKIYQRYLEAFKKGAYNYIKEEIDPLTQEMIPRKYFSGGFTTEGKLGPQIEIVTNESAASAIISPWLSKALKTSLAVVFVALNALNANAQGPSAIESVNSQVQASSSENNEDSALTVRFKKNNKGEFSVVTRGSGFSAEDLQKTILFEAMFQLSSPENNDELKSFLRKTYPDAVARVNWTHNKAAKVLLARFDHLNKADGPVADIVKEIDKMNAEEFVLVIAAKSRNEQEFNIFMKNFVEFKMVRSILQSREISLKLLQWRIDHENQKKGKAVSADKRPLAVVITDTADWNGALKDKALDNEQSFVESLINQGYRVLTTEASNFGEVMSSIVDFTQFGHAVLFLNAHGNPDTLGSWIALPTAPEKYKKGTGRVVINSNLEKQYSQMLEGRVTKVVLYSCSTGEKTSTSKKNIVDFMAKITGVVTYGPQEPIHRVDFGKDGGVDFYTREFGYGGFMPAELGNSDRKARSYIAQPPDPMKTPKSASSPGTEQNVGGIDLTKYNLGLEVDSQAGPIKFQVDPATFKRLRDSAGFKPVIFNVEPMVNLGEFLGIQS